MPTKFEHRAAVRSAIILAAMDADTPGWDVEADQLVDQVDAWLNKRFKPAMPSLGQTLSSTVASFPASDGRNASLDAVTEALVPIVEK